MLRIVKHASLWLGLALCVSSGSHTAHAEETTGSGKLRVMTYNIHHGRGTDEKIDLERIAAVIKKAGPDLVALQEVDIKTRRSGGVDQLAELARLTGMNSRFAKGRDYDGGDYGQAVLSRYPIKSFEVHSLPGTPESEARIAFAATIDTPGEGPDVLFVGTHLHHREESLRVDQARRLMEILDKREVRDAVLLGDLNAVPGSESMNLLLGKWEDAGPSEAFTFPSRKPEKKIDWILLPKGHNWRVSGGRVIEEPLASDHLPIIVDLTERGPDQGK